jgi:hypothetical protein
MLLLCHPRPFFMGNASNMTLRVVRVVVARVGIERVCSPGRSVYRATVSCDSHRAVRALEGWERCR